MSVLLFKLELIQVVGCVQLEVVFSLRGGNPLKVNSSSPIILSDRSDRLEDFSRLKMNPLRKIQTRRVMKSFADVQMPAE